MRLVLAGQPNSGKSTVFNAVAGYRAATANFPGSSVGYTISRTIALGRELEIIDLPGIYSLSGQDDAEREAVRLLIGEGADVIVNVVDGTRLGRSLELTLQLLELGRPLVVALNMADEAERKGIEIDAEALSERLGVPVVTTVGRRGQGLRELLRTAVRSGLIGEIPSRVPFDREIESEVARLVSDIPNDVFGGVPRRFLALKALEGDDEISRRIAGVSPPFADSTARAVQRLEELHGWSADEVVSGHRHALAHGIEEDVVTMHHPSVGWRERVDALLLHPFTGGPVMLAVLAGFFWAVFGIGQRLEEPLLAAFDRFGAWLAGMIPPETLFGTVIDGMVLGLSGGVAIVLPYLVPFLLLLAVLEDTGYLPRMAYILDNLMHYIGLHGKSVLPMVLGYGCTVPAIMATRILESPRDRRITAALTVFIPCSARSTIIYGLVAAYLGPWWALGIYVLNILVIAVVGTFLSRRLRGPSPGLVLEIPDLRLPALGPMLSKIWLNLREFITVAWPLLIASSAALGVLEYLEAEHLINALLSPLTTAVLGLPVVVGTTLVFGILRKELSLVMLIQALGTAAVGTVMTDGQLVTFTVFVLFYVPCVATIAAMLRELGWKDTAWISGLTVVVATVVGFAARLLFMII